MAGSVSRSSKGDGVRRKKKPHPQPLSEKPHPQPLSERKKKGASPPTPLRKERGVITEEGYGLNSLGERGGCFIKL